MDKRMIPTSTEKEVLKVLEQRWKVGRDRYKVGIDYQQQPNIEGWLNEAIEECADQLQYLVAMKLMLRTEKESINNKNG
jgi:hypothetical protein